MSKAHREWKWARENSVVNGTVEARYVPKHPKKKRLRKKMEKLYFGDFNPRPESQFQKILKQVKAQA